MAIFELKVTMLIVIYDSIDIENDLGFPLFALASQKFQIPASLQLYLAI